MPIVVRGHEIHHAIDLPRHEPARLGGEALAPQAHQHGDQHLCDAVGIQLRRPARLAHVLPRGADDGINGRDAHRTLVCPAEVEDSFAGDRLDHVGGGVPVDRENGEFCPRRGTA